MQKLKIINPVIYLLQKKNTLFDTYMTVPLNFT